MPTWRQQGTEEPTPEAGRPHYDAEVNKGSINMASLVAKLNARAAKGWRLHTVLEQHGNTIIVYERWG